jgi:hypothetical protein
MNTKESVAKESVERLILLLVFVVAKFKKFKFLIVWGRWKVLRSWEFRKPGLARLERGKTTYIKIEAGTPSREKKKEEKGPRKPWRMQIGKVSRQPSLLAKHCRHFYCRNGRANTASRCTIRKGRNAGENKGVIGEHLHRNSAGKADVVCSQTRHVLASGPRPLRH